MSTEADAARERMVAAQLRKRGIKSQRVLAAIGKVPRERFVPSVSLKDAYDDRALMISCGQTISQPYIVGLMTESLELEGTEHVLEVGTGSGYQSAVLAELAHDVVSVERHAELSATASETLAKLGYQNINLIVGDGSAGYPPGAPYDRIIVTAAAHRCPPAIWDQLAEGGIVAIPVGDSENQVLHQLRKRGGQCHASNLCGCRFVPLIGEQGWPD